MLPLTKSNSVLLTGLGVAAAGVIVYTQLWRLVDLKVSPAVLNGVALGGLTATLGGLSTMLVGSAMLARKVSTRQVVSVVVSIGAAVGLLALFGQAINVHRPSGILIFVAMFAVVDGFLLLAIRYW